MSDMTTLTISCEAEAWDLLRKTLEKSLPSEHFTVHFDGWPHINIKLDGPGCNATISTGMMASFMDLQSKIYQTYAKIKYDQSRARLLSKEERSALELVVQVKPGSSEYTAFFEKIADKLIETSLPTMTDTQFFILALVAILSYAGKTMYSAYLDKQVEHKNIELQKHLSSEETKRLELFKEAVARAPYAGTVQSEAETVYNHYLKSASRVDAVTVSGNRLERKSVLELVKPTRSGSQEVRLDGMYRIRKVDSTKANYFKVEVMDETGRTFPAVLEDQVLTTRERNKELLQDAEWSRKPIFLMMNGRAVRGDITQAKIIDVRDRFMTGSPPA